jgi:hypothetical protein
VELPASAENEFHVFRFPITAGTSYTLQVAGTATTSFGLSVSARAERGQNGEFLYSEWVMSAALPIVEDLAPKPTDAAISGFYYFAVKDGNTAQDPGPRTVTLTITAK